jgi:MscS family membrane protein
MKYILSLILLTLSYSTVHAAEDTATAPDESINAHSLGLGTAKETFTTFLKSMNDIKRGIPDKINVATSTLDLSDINPLIRQEKGRDIAWSLLEALDKTKIIDLQLIPNQENGKPYVFQQYDQGSITVNKLSDGRWLFSKNTIHTLPNILAELSDKKSLKIDAEDATYLPWHIQFRQQLPEPLTHRSFLLENWKWLAILLIIAIGVVLDKSTAFALHLVVKRISSRAKTEAFQHTPNDILRPLGVMMMSAVWWMGLNLIALPDQAMLILLVAVKILAGFAGVWGAYRLVDLLTQYMRYHADQTDNKVDDVLVPLIGKTLKVFVTVIGIVFIAANLNLNVSSLLASLGLGGLAFALAAKDVVQNLFGSITVILDRTFHTGDWIIVNDIEGSVEEVGLRSTRVRTFYDSLITVPNSIFITAKVDNMGNRRYRRLKCNVSLTYDTPPDKIEAFCEGVRELIRLHPYMRKDYFHVYLNSLGASSLDVLVYVFWETPDWSTELRERQRFLLDILRLAKAQGIDMAFPTQTLHLLTPNDEQQTTESKSNASLDELSQQYRESAKEIVTQSTGIDNKPPPVKF